MIGVMGYEVSRAFKTNDRSLAQSCSSRAGGFRMTDLRINLVFPRFKLLSGAERAILGLAEAMVQAGHTVRVVCHQFDRSCRPRLAPGVELVCSDLHLDPSRNRYLNSALDYARCLKLRHYLDPKANVQILFGPSLPLVAYFRKVMPSKAVILYYCWEPPRALYQDRKVILSRLGWVRPLVWPLFSAYTWFDRWLVGLPDSVCTSSPFSAGRVQHCYGRKASVVTLGVDHFRFDAARHATPRQPSQVLTVNYLHPRKRVDLFIRAAASCGRGWTPDRRPTFVVVGDGPERADLEALATGLGVADRVRFTGFVPDEDLPSYYAGASCYVHTGFEESFGLSVIEAAYCGCPVVSVDEGGVQMTVEDGVTGYRVSSTPSAIAKGVEKVLSLDDYGRSLGEAGHDRVAAKYTWAQGTEDIVRLVRQVAG